MPSLADTHIEQLAKSCVHSMGDIFWDHNAHRDTPLGYSEPKRVAAEVVLAALREFAGTLESNPIYTTSLRLEYREIVSQAGNTANDQRIISALIEESVWTDRGAEVVLQLAKNYGTSVLRNALALAEALGIEDGEIGL